MTNEKVLLNHMFKISSEKIDSQGAFFINFHYEGNNEDCIIVHEELERMVKKCLIRLGKKKG